MLLCRCGEPHLRLHFLDVGGGRLHTGKKDSTTARVHECGDCGRKLCSLAALENHRDAMHNGNVDDEVEVSHTVDFGLPSVTNETPKS